MIENNNDDRNFSLRFIVYYLCIELSKEITICKNSKFNNYYVSETVK